MLGYCSVHQRLRSRGIITDRESVRICMKVLYPAGVSLRKQHKLARRSYCNKGPNYLWHIDGNDKLKPFVLCFHAAIDGFSRKVLQLNVSPSNKDPAVISKYFLDFVSKINGQQELLELIAMSKIVLLLVCRCISIVKRIKITLSYLEDLPQIKELKRGGVI